MSNVFQEFNEMSEPYKTEYMLQLAEKLNTCFVARHTHDEVCADCTRCDYFLDSQELNLVLNYYMEHFNIETAQTYSRALTLLAEELGNNKCPIVKYHKCMQSRDFSKYKSIDNWRLHKMSQGACTLCWYNYSLGK